jgi:hypothetical protein
MIRFFRRIDSTGGRASRRLHPCPPKNGEYGVYGVWDSGETRESERETRETGERDTRGYEPFALHTVIH